MNWKNIAAICVAFLTLAAFLAAPYAANRAYDALLQYFADTPVEQFGVALPQGPAVFETSLQDRISSTDTSLTLVANSVRGGSALTGYNCFTIDEGRTDMEYVCGSVSGTAVTALERGIDPGTGTSTNSAVKFAHRKGANVKVTDYPLIQRLRAILNGSDTIPNLLTYAGNFCTAGSASTSVCSKGYHDALAAQGAPTSTEAVAGIMRIATALQAASSTDLGSNDPLALSAKNATSSPNGTVAALFTLILNNAGKIAQTAIDFAQTTNWSGLHTFTGGLTSTATTTVAGSNVNSNAFIINGVPGQYPSSQCASGQALVNNGSGVWSCTTLPTGQTAQYLGNSSGFTLSNTLLDGTSTPATTTVSNLLRTSGMLEIDVPITSYTDSGADDEARVQIKFSDTTVCSVTLPTGPAVAVGGALRFVIHASSSSAVQYSTAQLSLSPGSSYTGNLYTTCAATVDTSSTYPIHVVANWNAQDGGDTETLIIGRTTARFLGSN